MTTSIFDRVFTMSDWTEAIDDRLANLRPADDEDVIDAGVSDAHIDAAPSPPARRVTVTPRVMRGVLVGCFCCILAFWLIYQVSVEEFDVEMALRMAALGVEIAIGINVVLVAIMLLIRWKRG